MHRRGLQGGERYGGEEWTGLSIYGVQAIFLHSISIALDDLVQLLVAVNEAESQLSPSAGLVLGL
jgi:hypothetical protein